MSATATSAAPQARPGAATVILCGQVREPDRFYKTLVQLRSLRGEGRIGPIILSTWHGEVAKHAGLDALLRRLQVQVIAAREPRTPSMGNIFHQMKNLHLGLEQVEGSAWVLKTRTDVHLSPAFLRDLLDHPERLELEPEVRAQGIFQNRVWVPWFEISTPFYMADECFFGRAADLGQLVNFDARYDLLYRIGCGITQIRRFAHPFLDRHPRLHEFLALGIQTGLRHSLRFEVLPYLLEQDLYLEHLLAYYQILRDFFRIQSAGPPARIEFRRWSPGHVTVDPDQFRENFRAHRSWNPETGQIYAYDELWLRRLLDGALRGLPGTDRLYRVLAGQSQVPAAGLPRRRVIEQHHQKMLSILGQGTWHGRPREAGRDRKPGEPGLEVGVATPAGPRRDP